MIRDAIADIPKIFHLRSAKWEKLEIALADITKYCSSRDYVSGKLGLFQCKGWDGVHHWYGEIYTSVYPANLLFYWHGDWAHRLDRPGFYCGKCLSNSWQGLATPMFNTIRQHYITLEQALEEDAEHDKRLAEAIRFPLEGEITDWYL